MKVRMLFGTILPPPNEGDEPLELKNGSTQDLDTRIAARLVADGRAEYVVPPKDFQEVVNYTKDETGAKDAGGPGPVVPPTA